MNRSATMVVLGALLLGGVACGNASQEREATPPAPDCTEVKAAAQRFADQTHVPDRAEASSAYRSVLVLFSQHPECYPPGVVAEATSELMDINARARN